MGKNLSIKKILLYGVLGIVGLVLLLGVSFMGYSNYLAGKEYPQKKEVKTPSEPNGKQVLVVYQPAAHSTVTEDLAHKIAEGAVEKGAKVTLMRPTKEDSFKVNNFDAFVCGSPWYLASSEALASFMSQVNGYSGKEAHLFITASGQDEPSMFNDLENSLNNSNIKTKQVYGADAPQENLKGALELGRVIGENDK